MAHNATTQRRQTKGTPIGGQFAQEPKTEPNIKLTNNPTTPNPDNSDDPDWVFADPDYPEFQHVPQEISDATGLDAQALFALDLTIDNDENNNLVVLNKDGQLHNPNGPALISEDGNHVAYFQNGQPHNTTGPAVILNRGATKLFYQDGQLHNPAGPAIRDETTGTNEFWVNGQQVTPTEYDTMYPTWKNPAPRTETDTRRPYDFGPEDQPQPGRTPKELFQQFTKTLLNQLVHVASRPGYNRPQTMVTQALIQAVSLTFTSRPTTQVEPPHPQEPNAEV